MDDLVAQAYDMVKDKADPEFPFTPSAYQDELRDRAAHVDSSGLANTPFEIKYKELSAAAREAAKSTAGPLGTVATLAEARADVAVETESEKGPEEQSLDKLTRAELDEIAKTEFGFNPSDYSNKAEIVAAIEEARAKK